jgi:serine/threonine protein kinase
MSQAPDGPAQPEGLPDDPEREPGADEEAPSAPKPEQDAPESQDNDPVAPADPEVEQALLEFLALRGHDENADFDAFCRGLPDIAEKLRAKYEAWLELASLLATGGDELINVSRLFDTRTMPTIEPSMDLEVTLHSSGTGDDPTDLIERLARNAAPTERYDDLGELAKGGMGIIRRVRDESLRRVIAMKVMKPREDEDTDASHKRLATNRFINEALVTGQLDHPGIVPVHDIGVNADDELFFTMKLVKGRNMQQVFDLVRRGEEGWTLNRALNAILRVCEAVSYAHSKRVIHRDVKPANIMVGRYGETYLMDWGLARLLELADENAVGSVPDDALVSSLPEDDPDAGNEPVGQDTWLYTRDTGVIGTPPYMSPEQARGEVELVDERSDIYSVGALIYHLLVGHPPYLPPGPKPYPRYLLIQVGHSAVERIADLAPDAPPTLVAIAEKAMARDIKDRHADAGELAREIEDYLADISEDREEARRQARRAQLSLRFVMDALSEADPGRAQGRDVTVLELLDAAAKRVDTALTGQPLDEAAIRTTIGMLYKEQGRYAEGEPHLERSLDVQREVFGEDHRDTLNAATDLAVLYRAQGRHDEAEQMLRAALEKQEPLLGAGDADTLRTCSVLAAVLHTGKSRLDEAEELYRRALDGRRALFGADHADTLASMSNLSLLLQDRGRLDEALEIQRQVADGLERAHGALHQAALVGKNDLALMLQKSGRLAEAEPLYRDTLEAQTKVLGAAHSDTLTTMNNLAWLLHRAGRTDEAEALLTRAAETQRDSLGPDHQNTLAYLHNLALMQLEGDRAALAEPTFVDVVARAEAVLGLQHQHTARFRYNLARCLQALGRLEEGRAQAVAAHEVLLDVHGADHAWTREASDLLAGWPDGKPGG